MKTMRLIFIMSAGAILLAGPVLAQTAPPILDPIGDTVVAEGNRLVIEVRATDADLTIPLLSVRDMPSGAGFVDHGDGTGTFDWTPNYYASGVYWITVLALDAVTAPESDTAIVAITVPDANGPPVLDTIGPQEVAEGANLNFQVLAIDPDWPAIPVLTTSILPTNAWFVDNLDGTGIFNFDPDYSQWGTYAVTFYATDDSLAFDSEFIFITVTNAGGELFVTTLSDTGEGSLRYEIDLANTHIGEDTIIFTVSGTISVSSPPLALTDDRTLILGSTAPGGERSIVLDGQNSVSTGFSVLSQNDFIEDLVLMNFDDYAIRLDAGSRFNTITGCYLNLDPSGTMRGTLGGGVQISGFGDNTIGGCTEADRNVIAGGGGLPGIRIYTSSNNFIMGNYIGLAASGTATLTNPILTEAGIIIDTADGNVIGGYDSACGNIISGNATGIQIDANANLVSRNYIGLDRLGNPLGNESSGILIAESGQSCHNNSVTHNTIAFNGGNGIEVLGNSSSGNSFAGNEIFKNGLLAIDLGGDGVTANDPGDGDTGPNGLLNFPEIDSIMSLPDETYQIYGHAGVNTRVDIFMAHPAGDSTKLADPSGYGEAYYFLDSAIASPAGEFTFATDLSVAQFSVLSSTATDPLGNTSEFGENFLLLPKPMMVVAYTYPADGSPGPNLRQNGINIIVEDPNGNQFGRDAYNNPIEEILDAEYWDTPNDSIVIPNPIVGTYIINYIAEDPPSTGSLYAGIIKIDGSQETTIIVDGEIPSTGQTNSCNYGYQEGYMYVNGDANGDEECNIADAVFIVCYVFKGGLPPDPLPSGDSNCDTEIDVSDAVKIINYVFKGGNPPCASFVM